jgi:hypothetical protein
MNTTEKNDENTMKEKEYKQSDKYKIDIPQKNSTIIIYIYGNKEHKNIKPRIQFEIHDNKKGIIWDNNFDEIPPTKNDISNIKGNLISQGKIYTKDLINSEITKWDNGLTGYKKIYKSTMNDKPLEQIIEFILMDSEQCQLYIIHKICKKFY